MSETTLSESGVFTSSSVSITLYIPVSGERDQEYDLVPPLKETAASKGSQCGECGMKFEHGKTYGFHCGSSKCPMGYGWS